MRSFFSMPALAAALVLSGCASSGMASSPTSMSDADIVQVFMTSNTGEVVTSQPVLDDVRNADVRAYANMMVTEHTRVNERAMSLGIPPRPNMVSNSMTQQAAGIARQLEDAPAATVDMLYLEKQIVLHGNTLDMLDHVLIPNADDDGLQALLRETRPAVEMHLRRAMELHHQMMMGTR